MCASLGLGRRGRRLRGAIGPGPEAASSPRRQLCRRGLRLTPLASSSSGAGEQPQAADRSRQARRSPRLRSRVVFVMHVRSGAWSQAAESHKEGLR